MVTPNKTHFCPVERRGCGVLLTPPFRRGAGYQCRTDGCPIQKVHFDGEGNIVDVVYSTEPLEVPRVGFYFKR